MLLCSIHIINRSRPTSYQKASSVLSSRRQTASFIAIIPLLKQQIHTLSLAPSEGVQSIPSYPFWTSGSTIMAIVQSATFTKLIEPVRLLPDFYSQSIFKIFVREYDTRTILLLLFGMVYDLADNGSCVVAIGRVVIHSFDL